MCVINLDKADVIFAVDVGTNFESSAVDSVKDFIMSTLKVMELEEDKIRVYAAEMYFRLVSSLQP